MRVPMTRIAKMLIPVILLTLSLSGCMMTPGPQEVHQLSRETLPEKRVVAFTKDSRLNGELAEALVKYGFDVRTSPKKTISTKELPDGSKVSDTVAFDPPYGIELEMTRDQYIVCALTHAPWMNFRLTISNLLERRVVFFLTQLGPDQQCAMVPTPIDELAKGVAVQWAELAK